jgi:regulator of cell morphogenesis and NO signaling
MNFNVETRVNEIALSNPGARRQRLQQNRERARSDESGWSKAPLAELTRHIRERHHGYVRGVIPRLRGMLAKVREKHGGKHREIGEIETLFADVAREMLMHMQKEEQILFPYIDALERAANGNGAVEPPFFQTVRNPIYSMMQDHDAAGELVRKIRAASNGYQPPEDSCTTFKLAYQELQRFEEDLHLHVHLENNILFPRAVELEAAAV